MKLIVLARSSRAGGGARFTEIFARGMNKRGHQCRVAFTRTGDKSSMFHRRLCDIIIDSLCYRFTSGNHADDVALMIDQLEIDCVIIDNPERMAEVAAKSSRMASGRTKVIFLAHTQGTPATLLASMREVLWKVVCVSQKSADLLAPFEPVVIRNAVPEPPSTGSDVRAALGVPPVGHAFVVGYVGRHDQNKSTEIVVAAAEAMGYWCIMGGENAPPSDYEHYRSYPYEIEEVGDWYKAMTVFVLPSKEEGFPLAPMEALLAECPVVMTKTSDYEQCFEGAISFFDYGDLEGLQEAIRTAPPARRAWSTIARDFTVDRMLDQWEEVLGA